MKRNKIKHDKGLSEDGKNEDGNGDLNMARIEDIDGPPYKPRAIHRLMDSSNGMQN